jgi:hypothetical protein
LTWTNFRLNVDFFVQKIGLWTAECAVVADALLLLSNQYL